MFLRRLIHGFSMNVLKNGSCLSNLLLFFFHPQNFGIIKSSIYFFLYCFSINTIIHQFKKSFPISKLIFITYKNV